MRRLLSVAAAATAGCLALTALPAWADGPDQLTITSDELPEPLVLRVAESPRLVSAVYGEVSWLAGRSGSSAEVDEEELGPAYQLDVHVDGEVRDRYVLYPSAEGGPRVYRPAEQPDGRSTSEAWYYGRLSMPDTLTAAGAEIAGAQPRLPGGGAAGGGGGASQTEPAAAQPDSGGLVRTWLEGMQLTALVGVSIAAGLAAVALLIRRKV